MTPLPSRQLFGTDGIRGIVNQPPMTVEMAMALGRATAHFFVARNSRHRTGRPKIVLGKDTRLSGYMLENALAAGILSQGADVLLVGPLPTPAIAFLTVSMRADAGLVISASHNPYHDNGIKIFAADGFKLPDEVETELEQLMGTVELDDHRPEPASVGRAVRMDDSVGRYVVYLKNTFPRSLDLSGLNIVLDCANGAAYKAAPALLEELGARVHLIGASPDGFNINRETGSLYPEICAQAVLNQGADLGISLDGDADRIVFIDHKGREVGGDKIMALCAKAMKEDGVLARNTVVATIMSNMGLETALQSLDINLIRTRVGDRYVVEAMRQQGCNFGGEQSGHLIFLDHATTGDGLMAGLQVLAIMKSRGTSLAELAELMTPWPQVNASVRLPGPVNLNEFPQVASQVNKVSQLLGTGGRLLVRPSGTEPVVRIMLEGQDEAQIKTLLDETAEVIARAVSARA